MVVDACMKETYDEIRGITYPAWTTANPEDFKTAHRVLSDSAVPVMYVIKTSSADKHRIFVNAREMLATGDLSLPCEYQDAIEYYDDHYKFYNIEDSDLKARILNTYAQTDMLIFEAINLETVISGGYYNLKEKPSRRKDRVMSLCYNLDIVKALELEYIASTNSNSGNFLDFVVVV